MRKLSLVLVISFVTLINFQGLLFKNTSSLVYASTSKLTWAPPTLTNPITITLGTGSTQNTLTAGQDYIIKLPSTKKTGYTKLIGGRNIVIIGGYITIPDTYTSTNDRRAIYLNGQTGTVHIEGVLIDSSGGGQADAFAISAPSAIVQIQNVRAVNLRGGQDTTIGYEHADVIQPWGGVKELRVDHLTGSSNYQGLQIPQDQGPIGKSILKNINLSYDPAPPNDGGYLSWFTVKGDCTTAYPVDLSEVYITPKPTKTLSNSVFPDVTETACPAVITNNVATWPSLPVITGGVKLGPPISGDFVPDGVAGLSYVSPGYVSSLPAGCIGDYNKNGTVDIQDFGTLGQNYKRTGINCSLDITGGDCYLNVLDFQQFAQVYKIDNSCV